MTAEVIVASLTPSRVDAGVVGPCFYCGDNLASTVDHLVPVAYGGTDDRWNLVSSCLGCNVLKMTTPVVAFLQRYPRGSKPRRLLAELPPLTDEEVFGAGYLDEVRARSDVLEALRETA